MTDYEDSEEFETEESVEIEGSVGFHLPGKYTYQLKYEEYCVTITFQTLKELHAYLDITKPEWRQGRGDD